MSTIRIRPRIREFSNFSQDDIINKYKKIIASGKYPFEAKIVGHHLFVKSDPSQMSIWSPELTLDVVPNHLQEEEYADQKEPTLIKGFISPNPSIWMFFIFSYVGLGLIFLGLLVYGTSQMMLDQPTQLHWYALVSLALIVGVFISSQIGQKLGEDQTNELLKFVNDGLSKDD